MFFRALFLVALCLCGGPRLVLAGVVVKSLRCEYKENPLGIDVAAPRLGWILESAARGEKQTAYQVLAARDARNLEPGRTDLWDSGRVESAESTQVEYRGRALAARERVFWKVRVWDKGGKPSPFSPPAS